ncbi:MAG TPA: DUF4185 domain-containing protein [Polyangia bacterium]|jgi:hypothetical protein
MTPARAAAWLAVLAGALAAGCESRPATAAAVWPAADALFHGDARWIGGDGAYSVDLGDGRVLWLFGDSFIALGPERLRGHAKMIRNSVAIQTGADPTRAFMRFYWRHGGAEPQSFLPEDGADWFWPAHGVRLDDTLLLFYARVYQEGEGMWGFAGRGWRAVTVDRPAAEPAAWVLAPALAPAPRGGIDLGGAVVRVDDYLYVYGTATRDASLIIASYRAHDLYLARFAVAAAARGDLTAPAWWCGASGWSATGAPAVVLAGGAPEYSVHYEPRLGAYAMVQSEGAWASTLALRTAARPEGPWSAPRDLLRPPESYGPDPFVYAGKAHPEIAGADLVVTYVPSSFATPAPADEERLYYPRFVRVSFP